MATKKTSLSAANLETLRAIGQQDSLAMRKIMLWAQRANAAKTAGQPFTEPMPYYDLMHKNFEAAPESQREEAHALIKRIKEAEIKQLIDEHGGFPDCVIEWHRPHNEEAQPSLTCGNPTPHTCVVLALDTDNDG